MQYVRGRGRLVMVAVTLALLTALAFGVVHRPVGQAASASAITLASSNAVGSPNTVSGPPIA